MITEGITTPANVGSTLIRADDRHFRITVPIAVSPQFYGWVFGLKNMVTIESLQSVVDGMKEMLAAVEKKDMKIPKGCSKLQPFSL